MTTRAEHRSYAEVLTTRLLIPSSPDGPAVPALMHRPLVATGQGWIVWAHGGAWRHGSAAGWMHATHYLAAASAYNVLSLDYRLAPAYHHPAAVSDMLTAIHWLREQNPGDPIILGGDSAGGTLAAVSALACRDRGTPVQAQLLAYPPYDPHARAASYRSAPGAFPKPEMLRAAWRSWQSYTLRHAPDGIELLASPRDADSLEGVGPAVLVVGDRDPVRDDVAAYAADLRAAGVFVDHQVMPGVEHGDVLRPGSAVMAALAAALPAALHLAQQESSPATTSNSH